MTTPDQTLCPIPEMGYCIYERCSYWDQARQECDADCLKDTQNKNSGSAADPCTISWQEDYD